MLTLCAFENGDAQTILSWFPEERAFRFWSADRYGAYPATAADMAILYDGIAASYEFLPLTAVDENTIVGHCTLRRPAGIKNMWRLGFVAVDSAKRKKGYGSAMLRLALQCAFAEREVQYVSLGVFEENVPARRLYASLGFVHSPEGDETFSLMGEEWHCLELRIAREAVKTWL